jgi:hypothetical protein
MVSFLIHPDRNDGQAQTDTARILEINRRAEPVREWLDELPREDQRKIGRDIGKVQFG